MEEKFKNNVKILLLNKMRHCSIATHFYLSVPTPPANLLKGQSRFTSIGLSCALQFCHHSHARCGWSAVVSPGAGIKVAIGRKEGENERERSFSAAECSVSEQRWQSHHTHSWIGIVSAVSPRSPENPII